MRDRVLKARTAELYSGLLRNHGCRRSATSAWATSSRAAIRRWRKERLEAGAKRRKKFGPVTVAKAYGLLHAVHSKTAAEEDRILSATRATSTGQARKSRTNDRSFHFPSSSRSPRPVWLPPPRTSTTSDGVNWLGFAARTSTWRPAEVGNTETLAQIDKGGLGSDTPKSRAGKRTVAFPAEIAPEILWHLERFAEPGERGFVFVGPKGGKLRRSNFHDGLEQGSASGGPAQSSLSRLATHSGAPSRRPRARRCDGPSRGTPIYGGDDLKHATRDRDQAIAKALGTFVRDVRGPATEPPGKAERGEQGA